MSMIPPIRRRNQYGDNIGHLLPVVRQSAARFHSGPGHDGTNRHSDFPIFGTGWLDRAAARRNAALAMIAGAE
jgi:hypothetical protein